MTDSRHQGTVTDTGRWQVRPFGQTLGDMDIDPLAGPRPVTVTRVLEACLSGGNGPPGRQVLMDWPVNRRLQGLLAVTIATRGNHWVHTARCTEKSCGAPMDLPLSLDDFRRGDDPAQVSCTLPDGRQARVAVPTGTDQMAWLEAGDGGSVAVFGRLVSISGDPDAPPPEDAIEAVEAALEKADPLTTLELETACPECGAPATIPLDLEGGCLQLLAAQQPRLIDDIHMLATAYHWSEAEIMAIPPARRRQYLERIDRMWS